MQQPLDTPAVTEALDALNARAQHPWSIIDGKLCRNFRFRDFAGAFGFMTEAALVAERMDHHPEWRNVYNRVEVQLVTHDAKGLTPKDFALAEVMERAAAGR